MIKRGQYKVNKTTILAKYSCLSFQSVTFFLKLHDNGIPRLYYFRIGSCGYSHV